MEEEKKTDSQTVTDEQKAEKKTRKAKKPVKSKPEWTIWATGRRKTSIARIKMTPGSGKILINSRDPDKYFGGHLRFKNCVLEPIQIIPEASKFDYFINAHGGGLMGHSEAIRLGIARALSAYSDSFRPKLKSAGFLSRDPRMVERKKAGQPKARKRFQWTKR
ncbi:MAG: 30S ribosomal protein S9 [Elusimicrobiota bacterium]